MEADANRTLGAVVVDALDEQAHHPCLLLRRERFPNLVELSEGLGGILGIAILGFGLMQAWKQTGNAQVQLSGPFSTEKA